jgi:peptidoglycan/LPS O-acetylase OafA/YrhL
MFSPQVRKYLTLILIIIIFYIIVAIAIQSFGDDWIIALWSFPLLIFSLLFFLQRDKQHKLQRERWQCQRFILAYSILIISLIVALAVAYYYQSRTLTVAVAITVWLGLSAFAMLAIVGRNNRSSNE